jgi:hypothetical protein
MKTTVPNDQLEKMDGLEKDIDEQMSKLDTEYR